MFFCQNNYIDKTINKFNINTFYKSSKASLIHYVQMIKNKRIAAKQKIRAYQQRVEFINFATIITRFDVIFATSKFSEFFINSSTYHMKQVDKVFRSLTHTKNYVIIFKDQTNNSNIIFIKFLNTSCTNDLNIRQSFNDSCFNFFDEMIDWKVIK